MEKTIFLFRRKASRTKSDFDAHYVNNHAPLGRRLARVLQGYTVNLVEGEGGLDAVTEHWVPAAIDLLDPLTAYATMEDFETVLADDRTLFDGFDLYVVNREKEIVAGEVPNAPIGELTRCAKAVWMFAEAATLPPPPPGARRVVDSHVSHRLVHRGGEQMESEPSDIAVFRMAWADSAELLDDGRALMLREYRQIAPPAPGWT